MDHATTWVDATVQALVPLADPDRAGPMAAYMKDVAPFLGISAPARRTALRAAWRPLPQPTDTQLVAITRALWALPEREYQYAACDLIARDARRLPGGFLVEPIQHLLTSKPWWDTVDSLGSGAITGLVDRHPEHIPLMWTWLASGDRWLIRAAISHQRGLKERTDVGRLLAMCDRFAGDREFFVAKAIGWALRDLTDWNPAAVQGFVDAHPQLSSVARREAVRGLVRSRRPPRSAPP